MNGNQIKSWLEDAYLITWLIIWGSVASVIVCVQWMLGWNRRLP